MWTMRTIHLIYAVSFLDLLAVGLTFPLFSTYLKDIGASHTIIGLVSSAYSGIQVLSGPLIGSWSDIRDRKTVLRSTLLLCAVCYGLLGTTSSIWFILVVRFLLGVIKHTQTICKAVITDVIPTKEQPDMFAKSASIASLGFIFGPLIGGSLSELKNGFSYVCILTCFLFIVNYGIASFLPETTTLRNKTNHDLSIQNTVKTEISKTIKELADTDWKEHWDTFLIKFLIGLTITCYFTNQTVYLRETYQMSQKHIGYTISFFSAIGMISGFCLNKIDKIYKYDNVYQKLYHSFILLIITFIGLYMSPNIFIFMIFLVPLSFNATSLRVSSMELMFQKSKKFHRGSLSGTSNSIMSISRFLAPVITGFTSDIFSERSLMLVAIFPATLGLLVSILMNRKHEYISKDR